MDHVEVEITGQAITAEYGTLNTGDRLRTSAAFAKHLVEEAFCAKYTKPEEAVERKQGVNLVEATAARGSRPNRRNAASAATQKDPDSSPSEVKLAGEEVSPPQVSSSALPEAGLPLEGSAG